MSGGWLRTGDAGRVDDEGFLFISDRVKDMIVSGGENIYPREIEEVLFGMPEVADAAVVGVPSERWGESPIALVVAAPGAVLTERMVVEHCRAHLAGFKCLWRSSSRMTCHEAPSGKSSNANYASRTGRAWSAVSTEPLVD